MIEGTTVDLAAVHGQASGDGGVPHGARLVAFTEAAMRDDDEALDRERRALAGVLTRDAFVDACAVVGMFNVVDRIADATGIPLDAQLAASSGEVRTALDLGRFPSAANSRSVLGG